MVATPLRLVSATVVVRLYLSCGSVFLLDGGGSDGLEWSRDSVVFNGYRTAIGICSHLSCLALAVDAGGRNADHGRRLFGTRNG